MKYFNLFSQHSRLRVNLFVVGIMVVCFSLNAVKQVFGADPTDYECTYLTVGISQAVSELHPYKKTQTSGGDTGMFSTIYKTNALQIGGLDYEQKSPPFTYYSSIPYQVIGFKISTQYWDLISSDTLSSWNAPTPDLWGVTHQTLNSSGATCEDWTPPCHDEYTELIQTCDGEENIINWDETTCTGDCDLCPNDPNKTVPGICGCGVSDTDTDGDGTPDCNDECPDDPGSITSPCIEKEKNQGPCE